MSSIITRPAFEGPQRHRALAGEVHRARGRRRADAGPDQRAVVPDVGAPRAVHAVPPEGEIPPARRLGGQVAQQRHRPVGRRRQGPRGAQARARRLGVLMIPVS